VMGKPFGTALGLPECGTLDRGGDAAAQMLRRLGAPRVSLNRGASYRAASA